MYFFNDSIFYVIINILYSKVLFLSRINYFFPELEILTLELEILTLKLEILFVPLEILKNDTFGIFLLKQLLIS